MARKIIKGGAIVGEVDVIQADLVIEDGLITGILAEAEPGPGDDVIDAAGLLVLPGVVDAHTHIQLDTGIYKTADNWEVGTKAAAAGGVTTLIDFATQFPGQAVDEALDNRFEEAAPAVIDYALHCMITDLPYGQETTMLGRLVERGAPSFKIYTTYRPNYYMDDATILRLMRATYEVGGLVMVHAENDDIVTGATERLVAEGKTEWKYHAQGRPVVAEWEAANRLTYLAQTTNAPLYIVHCTSAETIDIVNSAREDTGLPIYCETCPQYLLLDDSVYEGPHPEHYILQPPLRNRYEQQNLWSGLESRARRIDVISTDSCDYTIAQKKEFTTFTQTPGGLPGVETLLPLIYTYGVAEGPGNLDLTDLARLISATPARIFGLYPQKGTINIGSDADIVLYDPDTEGTIKHRDLHYLAGYNPYEGMPITGQVVMTLSRGEVVYRRGAKDPFAEAAPGRGRFVPGEPFDQSLIL